MFGSSDYLYYFFKSRKKDYLIGDANFKRHIIRQEGNEIWICFLPWRNTLDKARKSHLLPKKGLVIAYEGPVSLAGLTPLQAKTSLEKLVDDLTEYVEENNLYKEYLNILGISIGNLPAFYIANNFCVKRLVAVCPGARLGENIYNGIATQGIRKKAEKGYPNSNDYDLVLEGLNPIDNLLNLPEGEIYIELSGFDKYIPTSSGEELIRSLIKEGKNPQVKRNRFLGHVLTIRNWGIKNKLGILSYVD